MSFIRLSGSLATVALAFAISWPANAQTTDDPQGTAPEPTVSASPASVPSPPSVPPAPAEAPAAPACRLAAHGGIPQEDASTVASLVCRELEAKGATANGHHYRVDLDPLGNSVYLTVTDENGSGSAASRRMRLHDIEEAGDAAPRLVDALLSGKSVTETERLGNLTDAEARAPLHKIGTLQVGVGAMGVYAIDTPTFAPGFELSLRYDTPSWVTHSTLRYAAHVSNDAGGTDQGLRVFDWGVGARYMFSKENTTPFFGAGLAYVAVQRDARSENGVGAFAEVGLELLRLHKNHFGAALRADAPMFSVSGRYALPLSVAVTATF